MEPIYLDHNATTPLLAAAREAMEPFLAGAFGNPASAHGVGRRARRALEDARERLAELLDAFPDEVLFTSGATEANNLAVFGLCGTPPGRPPGADAPGSPGSRHLLASPVEHPSVSEPLKRLAGSGYTLEHLPVDRHGRVAPEALPAALRPDTALVCVMLANHETGTLQPVQALTRGLRENAGRAVAFHCDATQAVGKIAVSFHALGVSALALSGHKFHGPQGVGALLVRRDVRLTPRTWGGHQQHGRRPGTEPVALAVGMTTALEHAHREREDRLARVRRLRECFLAHLREHAGPVAVNGAECRMPNAECGMRIARPESEIRNPHSEMAEGLPHTLNLSFPGLEANALLMSLDLAGVACSTGSACSSGSLLPSPVLQAMGVPAEILRSAMRFSFSPLQDEGEIAEAARRVAVVVNRLRRAGS